MDYTEGALAGDCGYEFCCRNYPDKRTPANPRYAGKWGDYNCNTPFATFKSMLDFIVKNNNFDAKFVTWTGDDRPNDVWSTDSTQAFTYAKNVTTTLKETIGKADPNIEFYPILGNHDMTIANI